MTLKGRKRKRYPATTSTNSHVTRYGGYVTRWVNAVRNTYSLNVFGPDEWDPTYFGDGTQIVEAIEAKCEALGWKAGTYEVTEVWRSRDDNS